MSEPFGADEQGRVLVVDDEVPVRMLLSRMLTHKGYEVDSAADGREALDLAGGRLYDLAFTDIMMPGMNGIELVERLLECQPDLAVIMVTAVDDPNTARQAIELGAYGYIIKPFELNEILINALNALRRRELELAAKRHREELEQEVAGRTTDLRRALADLKATHQALASSQEETIHRLARAAEFRDNETAQHIQRMSLYCRLLAQRVGLAEERSELVRMASTMHDVGKIGIPDDILLKPGRYNDAEYATMKQHAEIGFRILAGSDSPLLNLAADIALTHHEHVDGNGYPRGLRGNEIPLEGRIAAVTDVFDALTSKRVYKEAMPVRTAVGILQEGRGKQFDRDLLDTFLDSLDDILAIRDEFGDLGSVARVAGPEDA